jgi:hypothetical protein
MERREKPRKERRFNMLILLEIGVTDYLRKHFVGNDVKRPSLQRVFLALQR